DLARADGQVQALQDLDVGLLSDARLQPAQFEDRFTHRWLAVPFWVRTGSRPPAAFAAPPASLVDSAAGPATSGAPFGTRYSHWWPPSATVITCSTGAPRSNSMVRRSAAQHACVSMAVERYGQPAFF